MESKEKSKIDMFVVTHKELFVKIPNDYKLVGVGKNREYKNNNIMYDSTGDNISEKNANYCELTAIYWIWKNYGLSDYVGICHYRRFFVKGLFSKIYETDELLEVMKEYDIIMPHKVKAIPSAWKYFSNSKSGYEKDLVLLKELIQKDYPEYIEAFNEVMQSNGISYWNMCIMTKEDFNDYCNWIFELLFKYEKMVDLTGYNKQQLRIYGFMTEFLINVWIKKNNKKVKYENVLKYEESKLKTFLKKIKIQLYNIGRIFKNYDKN